MVVVVASVVAAPKDIAEVAGLPRLPNKENGVLVLVNVLLVAPKLPKLAEDAAAVDADQFPGDAPKPNCGL